MQALEHVLTYSGGFKKNIRLQVTLAIYLYSGSAV